MKTSTCPSLGELANFFVNKKNNVKAIATQMNPLVDLGYEPWQSVVDVVGDTVVLVKTDHFNQGKKSQSFQVAIPYETLQKNVIDMTLEQAA